MTVAKTFLAPFSFRVLAHSKMVLPVVDTSSIRSMVFSFIFSVLVTEKALEMFSFLFLICFLFVSCFLLLVSC